MLHTYLTRHTEPTNLLAKLEPAELAILPRLESDLTVAVLVAFVRITVSEKATIT